MPMGDGPESRRLPRSSAPGSRDRDYWVYAPRRRIWRRLTRRPALLIVLHGCRQTGEDMIRATRFVEQARARDVVVVFPSVTSWNPLPYRISNCWGFWLPAERRRGEGEIGDLRRLMASVEDEFGTDPRHRYVAGLSSVGAMAVAMTVAYPEAIRAAASVAGLAYGESSAAVSPRHPLASVVPWFLEDFTQRPTPSLSTLPTLLQEIETAQADLGTRAPVPLLIMQSRHDRVVSIENAEMLRDVWVARAGGPAKLPPGRAPVGEGDGECCRYVDTAGRALVETVLYEGRADDPTHYWPGDSDAGPFADLAGPSATRAALDFFGRHGL